MKVGVAQECDYNVGWGRNLGYLHRTRRRRKISVTVSILPRSDCLLNPGDQQGYGTTYGTTIRKTENKCLLAYFYVICP